MSFTVLVVSSIATKSRRLRRFMGSPLSGTRANVVSSWVAMPSIATF